MPIYFWMSTQAGNLVDLTAHTSCNGCSPMQKPLGERNIAVEFGKVAKSMPKWDSSMETPTIDFIGYKTT